MFNKETVLVPPASVNVLICNRETLVRYSVEVNSLMLWKQESLVTGEVTR